MQRLDAKIMMIYRQMVENNHPGESGSWPILCGYNLKFGKYRGWSIFFYENTGNPMTLNIPLEQLTSRIVGVDDIGSDIELARKKLIRHFRVTNNDMLILLNARGSNLEQELQTVFKQHELLHRIKKENAPKTLAPETEIPETSTIQPAPDKATPVTAKELFKAAREAAVNQPGQSAAPQIEFLQADAPLKEIEQTPEEDEPKITVGLHEPKIKNKPQKNKVFIMHGSSEKTRRSMSNFLLSLGLHTVEWPEAMSLTGDPDADDAEVVGKIFEHCQAAVVILTIDKKELSLPDDEQSLKILPQAELRTLFVAGLAAGINRHRTVVVGLGNTEPFRSLQGLHMTSLDNTLDKRKELMDRLKIAGCDVKAKGKAWHISGDFDIVLKPVFAEKAASQKPADSDVTGAAQASLPQPDTAAREVMPAKKRHSKTVPPAAESKPVEADKGRSFIESLPIMNILMPRRQQTKAEAEEAAAELRAELKSKIKPETIVEEVIEPAPAEVAPPAIEQNQELISPPEQAPAAETIEEPVLAVETPVMVEQELPLITQPESAAAVTETVELPAVQPVVEAETESPWEEIDETLDYEEKLSLIDQAVTSHKQPEFAQETVIAELLNPQPIIETEAVSEQEPVPDNAPGQPPPAPSPAERECLDKIEELEEKLNTLKRRGGRFKQRTIADLSKQIEEEKQRLNFLSRLVRIENLNKIPDASD
jgi:hypothetical protein